MAKKQFLMAIGILAVPVAIFFILNKAKQNYNLLPILGERIAPDGKNIKDTIFYQVPNFKVTDQSANQLSLSDFNGNILVVNFFFASCQDVCPTMNRRLETVYDKAKEYAEVKFLSLSVDPLNDTLTVLKNYSTRFNANPAIWHFARTATNEEIVKIGRGFLLPVSIEDKTIDHSQQFILIDKQRRIRGIYNSTEDAELKRLNDEIKVLLYEYHKK